MTPQNTPLEISEEAKVLAKKISKDEPDHLARTAEYYWEVQVQDSINSATAKLREENESLQKQIVGLKLALLQVPCNCDNPHSAGHYDYCNKQIAFEKAGANFFHLYVRREVLEKCLPFVEAVRTHGWNFASASFMREADEALTLARKELWE